MSGHQSMVVLCVIICAIVAIQVAALFFGFNGTLLRTTVAAVAGLGGWTLRTLMSKKAGS